MADFYKYHVFFCTHQRDDAEGKAYCMQHDAQGLRDHAKQRVKDLKLKKVRINNAGCLNRCAQGPMMVVYPQGVWYQYHNQADVDEIIEQHLVQGQIVERLQK